MQCLFGVVTRRGGNKFFFLEVSRKNPLFPWFPQRYKNLSILLHLVPGPPLLSVLGFQLSISICVSPSHTHHLPSHPNRTYLVLESFLAERSNKNIEQQEVNVGNSSTKSSCKSSCKSFLYESFPPSCSVIYRATEVRLVRVNTNLVLEIDMIGRDLS